MDWRRTGRAPTRAAPSLLFLCGACQANVDRIDCARCTTHYTPYTTLPLASLSPSCALVAALRSLVGPRRSLVAARRRSLVVPRRSLVAARRSLVAPRRPVHCLVVPNSIRACWVEYRMKWAVVLEWTLGAAVAAFYGALTRARWRGMGEGDTGGLQLETFR